MINKEEPKQPIKEVTTQSDTARVKERTAEFLYEVDTRTPSLAEPEFTPEGISREELRSLCTFCPLPCQPSIFHRFPTHAVCILMVEHEVILQNLERLRKMIQIDAADGSGKITNQLDGLKAIARIFLEAESHHQREEEALFPRLERYDVTELPGILRLEHEELRARKRKLAELAEKAGSTSFIEFARELSEVGGYIVSTLKEHIYQEDNILYPATLNTLKPEEWDEIEEEFNGIGYCRFTPQLCFTPGVDIWAKDKEKKSQNKRQVN